MKSTLNVGHIEAFRSVMLVGTVVGAAKLLNSTQPGVSRTIGLLERRLGYALFVRNGRRLTPTAEAEALYREIEPLYGSLERITEIAQDIGVQRAGSLRIATMPALAHWLVPQAIARFLTSRPNVNVFVEGLRSRQVAERVSTRQFDLGVVEIPLFQSAVTVEPIDPMPYVAVIPAQHRLANKAVVSLADLEGERLVLMPRQSRTRHLIDDALATMGIGGNVILETPSAVIACGLVAANAGIALVGKLAAIPFDRSLVAIRPLKEPFAARVGVIFPESGPRLMLADAFADVLRDEFRRASLL